MIEKDNAIRNILFETVAGQSSLTAFARDYGSEFPVLKPTEHTPQFGTEDGFAVEPGKESLNAVKENSFGAYRVYGVAEANKKSFQIIFAGLLDQGAIEIDVINHQHFSFDQVNEVETQG